MTNRRSFLKQAGGTMAAFALPSQIFANMLQGTPPKISLAQWSINRTIRAGELKAENFPAIAKQTYGIDAIEHVAGLYPGKKSDRAFWRDMAKRSSDEGVTDLLIMVDDEGELGDPSDNARLKAAENHYPWVDNAKTLGCHSIRVNAFGLGSKEDFSSALVDGLGRLVEYAAKEEINILIENHGLYSSNARLIVDVIKEVDNPYLGTLPDFGNWCMSRKWGSTQDEDCDLLQDPYEGVSAFIPYAKGVSAKSYNFDDEGNQTYLDYRRFLKIVKDFGYDGYIGIEYEGTQIGEHEGILATKALIEKVWQELG